MPRRTFTPLAAACALAAMLSPGAWRDTASAAPLLLPCEQEGAWTRSDRQVHFAGSLAIAASLRVEGRSRGEALAITLGIGAAKELYDATLSPKRPRGASRKDFVADALGAAAGILLLTWIDR